MEIIQDPEIMQKHAAALCHSGRHLSLVPTMGALHSGHLSLIHRAQEMAREGEVIIATIFVNPKQFDNPDDLARYPNTLAADTKMLEAAGVDILFLPDMKAMYHPNHATSVLVSDLTDVLCGAHRPGHFDGVALVVAKLFNITHATRAFFGEKDMQQLAVIRRFVRDLNFDVEIIPCPIMREADGLALSSRNLRLGENRPKAAILHARMQEAVADIQNGVDVNAALEKARLGLLTAGFEAIDYLELRDRDTLEERLVPDLGVHLFAAAFLGGVRLIDNIPLVKELA